MTPTTLADVPPHVPPALVFDFDVHSDLRLDRDLHEGMSSLHADAPRIFFTRQNGGHWVLTHFDDVRSMMLAPRLFSSSCTAVPRPPPDFEIRFPPLDLDNPEHRKIRPIVNKFLSPSVVRDLEPKARELARELIADIATGRAVDFVERFSTRLPVVLWMTLMGMDLDRRREFIDWVHVVIGPFSAPGRDEVVAKVADYFTTLIDRRQQAPADSNDPLSILLSAEVDGEKLPRQTVLDICNLMLTAGLDTVTNALTFIMRYLAQNASLQNQLRADPALIPRAVDELMRRFSFVNTARIVTEDVQFGNVAFKQGDQVLALLGAANLDPQKWKCPFDVDLDRDVFGSLAFNTGPHNCAGIHLAKMELRVSLDEWLATIPEFQIAPASASVVRKGQTMGLENLDLVW